MKTTMRWWMCGWLVLMAWAAGSAIAATDAPPPESDVQSEPAAAPPPGEPSLPAAEPTKPKIEKPKPVVKPKPAEKPRPVEPPRAAPDKPKPAMAEPPTPAPPPSTYDQPTPAAGAVVSQPPAEAGEPSGRSLACWIFSFAMLIVGFAAGFVARHLWTRRQLGGMTVRIGTWRGIP